MEKTLFTESKNYAKFRPSSYPDELFKWLTMQCKELNHAWDCATGTGQSAIGLAKYFTKVTATDLHHEQIDEALHYPNITYKTELAEDADFAENTLDLITCSAGVHWLDLNIFYKIVKKALKTVGIIAVWTYEFPWSGDSQIDTVLQELKNNNFGKYWTNQNLLYLNHYKDLYFPFDEIEVPKFSLKFKCHPKNIIDFISTWSVVQRYKLDTGY